MSAGGCDALLPIDPGCCKYVVGWTFAVKLSILRGGTNDRHPPQPVVGRGEPASELLVVCVPFSTVIGSPVSAQATDAGFISGFSVRCRYNSSPMHRLNRLAMRKSAQGLKSQSIQTK